MKSPTPWRHEEVASNSIDIFDANGYIVCSLTDMDTDLITDQMRANAEVIVRCVNSDVM